MNSKRIAFGIGIVLAVLAVLTASAMAGPNTLYFVPQHSSVDPGETTYVEVWLSITDPHGGWSEYAMSSMQVNITFDPNIGDITACEEVPGHPWELSWGKNRWGDSWWILPEMDPWDDPTEPYGLDPGVYPVANFTIKGMSPGMMDLIFIQELPRDTLMFDAIGDLYPNQTLVDGTFTCVGPAGAFEKDLVLGWNLVSLPLTPLNSSTSAVLGNDTIVYDTVYKYNAETKKFEDVTTGTMDSGIGYFVNVTTAGTWTYGGTPPYNSMSIDLKQGLNMVGWLNCSKQISGNLTSIAGKYNYNARWNAGYEVYEPHAPEVFNDFETMERGEGYWIAAKEDCTLTVGCSG